MLPGMKTAEQQAELVTATAAGRIAGVAAETIRVWERQGKLSAVRTSTGVRIFRADDVRVAAERRKAQRARGRKRGAR